MQTLNKFARFYNAQILRRSGANSRLGDLYDWTGIFNNHLTPVNDNIINYVVTDPAAHAQMLQDIAAAPMFAANFAEVIDLTDTLSVGVHPDLPNLPVKLAAELASKKVFNFHFEGVVQRPMPDDLGIQLRLQLDQFKADNPDKYRKYLRPYDLAILLYYAKEVVLRLDASQHISAEAQAEVQGIKVAGGPGGTVTVDATGQQELRFDQSTCPFAATLKATQSY